MVPNKVTNGIHQIDRMLSISKNNFMFTLDSLVGIDTQLGKSTGKPICIFSTMTITNKTYNNADGGFRVSIENVCKREVTCVDFFMVWNEKQEQYFFLA